MMLFSLLKYTHALALWYYSNMRTVERLCKQTPGAILHKQNRLPAPRLLFIVYNFMPRSRPTNI